MSNRWGAKFTHFLAEFPKSIQASDSTLRGRSFDLTPSLLKPLYTKFYDVFCGCSNVFRTFKLAGQ